MLPISFSDIVYEASHVPMAHGSGVVLELSGGEDGCVRANVRAESITSENYYALVSWGDGVWSYNGPFNNTAVMPLEHSYHTEGLYEVQSLCISLKNGRAAGWSTPVTVRVNTGVKRAPYISMCTPISSSDAEGMPVSAIADNNAITTWRSLPGEDINAWQWAGYLFDKHYRLDAVEIKTNADAAVWPANLAVEYTTDWGVTWYALPKYYYLYPYSEGRYLPFMNFPNPTGATLRFDMDGII